jgi:hypothetical protein
MAYYQSNEYLQKYGSSVQKSFMELGKLHEIIENGENEQTEFKLKVKYPEKIVNEVVAFANTTGGYLCIGIDDFGTVKGVKFPEDEEFELVRAIEKFCKPMVDYKLFRVKLPDLKEVIVFRIFESTKKPIYMLEEGKPILYVRAKDKSIKASKALRKIITLRNNGFAESVIIGEKETILFKYLETNHTIDVLTFAQIASLPNWLATNILVRLVLSNVISIEPNEYTDTYKMVAS